MSSIPSFFQTQQFDASKVEPAQGFDPIPDGDYVVMVEKAEEQKGKNDCQMLVLTLRVMQGQYQKRTLFARITLWNQNPKAVEIGRAQLSAFCRATGVMTPKSPFEFANKTLIITVKVVTRQDNNQLANEVKAYKPTNAPSIAHMVQGGSSAISQPVSSAPAAPIWGAPQAAPVSTPVSASIPVPLQAQTQQQTAATSAQPLPQRAPWLPQN